MQFDHFLAWALTKYGHVTWLKNQMKFIFLESTWQELSKNIIFIYFGQVFQTLWQYKCNLTTFGMGSYQIWPCHVTQESNEIYIFGKHMTRAIQKCNFYLFWTSISNCNGNINAIWPLFGMGSYQIWPCHVTQDENLSFPYLRSYCPLNFRKSHQISWFCCIPNGSYKEDNLKEGRICPPPPPPHVE